MSEKVKDPVCGMEVEKGRICSEYKDKKYCFCSESCKEQFEQSPEKYITDSSGCCH
ncbi:YHS domain-containing protein [bacterium]|nr:YHS domain-containing protein [bacterium]